MPANFPMPIDCTIHVVRDVPGTEGLRWWEIVLRHPGAHVCDIKLPADEDGYPDITDNQWRELAAAMVKEYPGCSFAYA